MAGALADAEQQAPLRTVVDREDTMSCFARRSQSRLTDFTGITGFTVGRARERGPAVRSMDRRDERGLKPLAEKSSAKNGVADFSIRRAVAALKGEKISPPIPCRYFYDSICLRKPCPASVHNAAQLHPSASARRSVILPWLTIDTSKRSLPRRRGGGARPSPGLLA